MDPLPDPADRYGLNPDQESFVRHFRSASPYIAGHRGSTFVIVIPGVVLLDKEILVALVDDIAMLHGMGIRLILVLGAAPQINAFVRFRGARPRFISGYRVTDELSMEAAMEAAGSARVLFEALLSKGPAVPMVRRHARTDSEFHYSAAINVVSGNYIAAKRRGVVNGVDYCYTGTVRFIDADAVRQQLANNNVVLLSNLGYSAGGELLNCNTFDVAVHAAVGVKADKVFCMHLDEVKALGLPAWLSLTAARELFTAMGAGGGLRARGAFFDAYEDSADEGTASEDSGGEGAGGLAGASAAVRDAANAPTTTYAEPGGGSVLAEVRVRRGALSGQRVEPPREPASGGAVSFNTWRASSLPPAVMACYEACRGGVKRAHLVDARIDGGMLLELYSRDGIGTMISADFYEGIRRAGPLDVLSVRELLAPLEAAGIVVPRSEASLAADIDSFVVIEREQRVLACAQLRDLGASENGACAKVGEIAAFCVHPDFRGTGRGDSLLDWLEQDARCRGFDCLVLLTTRTADWFQARDFRLVGAAHVRGGFLSTARRKRVDPARNSQLFMKRIEAPVPGMALPGTRIGF